MYIYIYSSRMRRPGESCAAVWYACLATGLNPSRFSLSSLTAVLTSEGSWSSLPSRWHPPSPTLTPNPHPETRNATRYPRAAGRMRCSGS